MRKCSCYSRNCCCDVIGENSKSTILYLHFLGNSQCDNFTIAISTASTAFCGGIKVKSLMVTAI